MSESSRLEPDDTLRLIDAIAAGEKPVSEWRIGTEYETFGLTPGTLTPLHYSGDASPATVKGLLERLQTQLGWEPMQDGEALIGIKSGYRSVQLEPSGQVEYSGPPVVTIREAAEDITAFEAHKSRLTEELGIQWLWSGFLPVHRRETLDLMPKHRYGIMRKYLPTRGKLAAEMMQRTTTVQSNLDFRDETDMGHKLRTSMGFASLLAAIFANSPFTDGRPNGYRSYRTHIWDHTDPDRCGLLPWVFDGALPTYERYVEWALDVPLFFIVRDGQYLDCAGLPFRSFLTSGFKSHQATLSDWETHLSTLFPEVRVKSYIELRSADCVPPHLLLALPAISRGLLYHSGALDAAWDLVKRWSFEERQRHREDVAKMALKAPAPGGHSTKDLAQELVSIARQSLDTLAAEQELPSDAIYLDEIEALVRKGTSPADVTLQWFAQQDKPTAEDILAHYTHAWPSITE